MIVLHRPMARDGLRRPVRQPVVRWELLRNVLGQRTVLRQLLRRTLRPVRGGQPRAVRQRRLAGLLRDPAVDGVPAPAALLVVRRPVPVQLPLQERPDDGARAVQ